ncbi:MAG: T9SS type A sorting domain-containing protein, partial [Bacteroidia bacterium]|nr:T9SS type A sorting domain-containing protein [Bacteroidia bacterium]
DYWLVRINAQGDTLWTRTLGGNGIDYGYAARQTPDGGFIVCGTSAYNATAGDVNPALRPIPGGGGYDIWVMKLDAAGQIQWQQLLGGSGVDYSYSIEPVSAGGYILAGTSSSANGTLSGISTNGGQDAYAARLAADGSILWQTVYGGGGTEYLYSISETADGGFIAAGYSNYNASAGSLGSTPRPVPGAGGEDGFILKLNSDGSLAWQKLLGGTGADRFYGIQETGSGEFIVSGQAASASTDGTLAGITRYGNTDAWVLKLDATGNILWQKILGGSGADYGYGYTISPDNSGYVLALSSGSNDQDVSGNNGSTDLWLVKLDNSGQISWQKTLGSSGADYAYSITRSSDGGLVAAGGAAGGGISDNHGSGDFWVVKLRQSSLTCTDGLLSDTICEGSAFDFNGTLLTDAGVYSDTLQLGDRDSVRILQLSVTPAPLSLSSDSICSGDSYDFFGTQLSAAGIYTHTLQTAAGCDSIVQLTLSILPLPDPQISISGSQLSTGSFSAYQWYLDGDPLNGGTGQTWTITQNGSYTVEVTDAQGCSRLSAAYVYSQTGLEPAEEFSVRIFPVPAADELNVYTKSNIPLRGISLYSAEGRLLRRHTTALSGSVTLRVSDLAPGVYLLQVELENERTESFRFIKQ